MFKSSWNIVIHLVALVLALEVVFLVIQNRSLEKTIENAPRAGSSEPFEMPPTLEIGDRVPPMELVDIKGNVQDLDIQRDKKKLLFAFSTQCHACQDTIETWLELNENLEGAVEVAGISPDSTAELSSYSDQQALAYPVFTGNATVVKQNFKLSVVPQTILLDEKGVVMGIWKGTLNRDQLDTITRMALNMPQPVESIN